MGIRFFCEHCHKQLNVKLHQAGQEGVCPKCDVAIRVPKKSTILSKAELAKRKKKKAERRRRQEALAEQAAKEASSFSEIDEATDKDSIDIQTVEQFQAERARRKALRDSRSSFTPPADRQSTKGSFLLDKPVNPWLAPNGPDPIATGLKKVWYIRHPQGREEGPVKGRHISEMLDNGKIVEDCFVWREDWQDWHRASTVFKKLASENELNQAAFTSPHDVDVEPPFLDKKKVLMALVAIVVGLATIAITLWLLNSLW